MNEARQDWDLSGRNLPADLRADFAYVHSVWHTAVLHLFMQGEKAGF